MDALPAAPAIGAGWILICGAVVTGAAVKETVRLLGESPLAVAAKRPSLRTMLIAGFLVRTAVGRIGRDALGLHAGG
jgi:hypothetical protein